MDALTTRCTSHGITVETFQQTLKDQDYRCRICYGWITEATCHIDHDHETGFFRGLLCPQCNIGLGNFHDSIEFLERAIKYLELSHRWQGMQVNLAQVLCGRPTTSGTGPCRISIEIRPCPYH